MEAEAEAEAVALKGDAEAYAIEIKAKAEVGLKTTTWITIYWDNGDFIWSGREDGKEGGRLEGVQGSRHGGHDAADPPKGKNLDSK